MPLLNMNIRINAMVDKQKQMVCAGQKMAKEFLQNTEKGSILSANH